jgi:hypothetical protein
VAGIATLLLAMGVGVEIGRLGSNSNTTPARASSPVQVVTVGGSGGGGADTAAAHGATTAAAAASSSSSSAPTSSNVNTHTNNKATPKVTKVIAQKAAASASKVLGAAAPKNPTVTTGESCTAGEAGCQNGKFTGNFFGNP